MRNKHARSKSLLSSLSHKHHFASPNTWEIVFTLLFIGVVYRVLSILGRDVRY